MRKARTFAVNTELQMQEHSYVSTTQYFTHRYAKAVTQRLGITKWKSFHKWCGFQFDSATMRLTCNTSMMQYFPSVTDAFAKILQK